MNRSALKKNVSNLVRIRPIVKRFCGTGGPRLPPVDDDWLIQLVADDGVRISNNNTGHDTILGAARTMLPTSRTSIPKVCKILRDTVSVKPLDH
jgi:hypothetical protein